MPAARVPEKSRLFGSTTPHPPANSIFRRPQQLYVYLDTMSTEIVDVKDEKDALQRWREHPEKASPLFCMRALRDLTCALPNRPSLPWKQGLWRMST